MTRFFSVHGHFYQPPREDPIAGIIPTEKSAVEFDELRLHKGFTNWNEIIDYMCYTPNSLRGNFSEMSFNVGPTLFDWLEKYDPDTYDRIIEQEASYFIRHGVSNSMAQSHDHTILPLASLQDKITQTYWGIADWMHRFGKMPDGSQRRPQGMWLPESAADDETLYVLATMGIEFTILAPWQLTGMNDARRPHRLNAMGKEIIAFPYDDVSGTYSFDGRMTENADRFITETLAYRFSDKGDQIDILASDGELYGHHKEFRDLFLQSLLNGAASSREFVHITPAYYLKTHEVKEVAGLVQNSSWSCHHGVIRWTGDCDCGQGLSSWKYPLRQAMNDIAQNLDSEYADEMRYSGLDPWDLRNKYIHVVLGEISLQSLLAELGARTSGLRIGTIDKFLRSQYIRQRIFNSCIWYEPEYVENDGTPKIVLYNGIGNAAYSSYLQSEITGEDTLAYLKPLESVWPGYGPTGLDMAKDYLSRIKSAAPSLKPTFI